MEKFNDKSEPVIVYSHAVKAGKRIYYLDVKKTHNEDLYVCITESKRKPGSPEDAPQYEKHKIFLYKEDFAHFTEGMNDVIGYVKNQLGDLVDRPTWSEKNEGEVEAESNEETPAEQKTTPEEHHGLFSRFRKD